MQLFTDKIVKTGWKQRHWSEQALILAAEALIQKLQIANANIQRLGTTQGNCLVYVS